MHRRLRPTLAVLTLLLWAMAVAVWVRSQSRLDVIRLWHHLPPTESSIGLPVDLQVGCGEYDGVTILVRDGHAIYTARPIDCELWRFVVGLPVISAFLVRRRFVRGAADTALTILTANAVAYMAGDAAESAALVVDMALLTDVLAEALLPMPKPRVGCCLACGYDLRATPLRCPECGTEAARAATDANKNDAALSPPA